MVSGYVSLLLGQMPRWLTYMLAKGLGSSSGWEELSCAGYTLQCCLGSVGYKESVV